MCESYALAPITCDDEFVCAERALVCNRAGHFGAEFAALIPFACGRDRGVHRN